MHTHKKRGDIVTENNPEANKARIRNCLLKLQLFCCMHVQGIFEINYHDPLDPLLLLSKFFYLMPVNVFNSLLLCWRLTIKLNCDTDALEVDAWKGTKGQKNNLEAEEEKKKPKQICWENSHRSWKSLDVKKTLARDYKKLPSVTVKAIKIVKWKAN